MHYHTTTIAEMEHAIDLLAESNRRWRSRHGRVPGARSARSSPPAQPPNMETAGHEAGHAIAAVFLGLPLSDVFIDGETGAANLHSWDGVALWPRAVFLSAGPVAEWLFLPPEQQDRNLLDFAGPCAAQRRPGENRSDHEQLAELVPALRSEIPFIRSNSDPFAAFGFAFGGAEDLLRGCWQSVIAVRSALVERGRLTGAEVRKIAGLGS